MGPRPRGRGEWFHRWRGCHRPPKLQWGHALAGVESTRVARRQLNGDWLQWGHALAGVERLCVDVWSWPRHALQWGHALAGVESWHGLRLSSILEIASMGPRPRGRGEAGKPV